MNAPPPVIVAWSGGKDSALALHEVRASGEYEPVVLLTNVTAPYDRISVHGVRRTLLEAQAESLNLPLDTVELPAPCSNEEYERRTAEVLTRYLERGITTVVYGDLFLEEIRRYREEKIGTLGMATVFPLWQRDTSKLAHRFLDLGYRAVITCVDTQVLPAEFSGREYDAALLRDLPEGIDPCGENGEFHTFVYDGPAFATPVGWRRGERVLRDERFAFCDLLPASRPEP